MFKSIAFILFQSSQNTNKDYFHLRSDYWFKLAKYYQY
jgi:hypothetical protein